LVRHDATTAQRLAQIEAQRSRVGSRRPGEQEQRSHRQRQ
jgi:hypothetical protein